MTALGGCGSSSGSGPSGPSFAVSFHPGSARSAREEAVRVEVYLVSSCQNVELGERDVPSVASTFVLKGGDAGGFETIPPPGDYGLYGLAQDANCAVVAAGCEPVVIDSGSETLSVRLRGFSGLGCGSGESCSMQSGECQVGGAGGAGGDPIVRVDEGLIVLYEFDEGSGATVSDSSGVAQALDLSIADPANVTWSPGYLTIDSATTLSTAGAATKVFSEVVPNEALSLEAWIKPASLIAVGTPPDRIVSMSTNGSNRNFLLGQDAGTYAARFRTEGENNGNPTIYTSPASATTLLQHVVFTHAPDGSEALYVDGVQNMMSSRSGTLSTWDPSFPLVVANEASGGREWLGELHLIAVYDRALSEAEVTQNFDAGP